MTVALSHLLGFDAPSPASGDMQIAGLTADSREVKPGFLFAALPGVKADGATFIDKAFAAGAVAVICKSGSYSGPHKVIAVENPRHMLALIAARFSDRQPDTIVAFTGPTGKTSSRGRFSMAPRALPAPFHVQGRAPSPASFALTMAETAPPSARTPTSFMAAPMTAPICFISVAPRRVMTPSTIVSSSVLLSASGR